MSERRRSKRIGLRRRVWCEGERYTVWLSTVDASQDGLSLRTSIPPPIGTRVRVTFEEPGRGRIVADAEVVWVKPAPARGGMGLKIVGFVEGREHWPVLLRDGQGEGEVES